MDQVHAEGPLQYAPPFKILSHFSPGARDLWIPRLYHCGCRTYEYTGDVKKTKQNISGVPVITKHIQ